LNPFGKSKCQRKQRRYQILPGRQFQTKQSIGDKCRQLSDRWQKPRAELLQAAHQFGLSRGSQQVAQKEPKNEVKKDQ
jgi:hypothetical protein